MQRYMDKKLHRHKAYARCYVDDIVVFSKTFEEHIQHLRAVLGDLAETGMTLAPTKCYVGYHSIELLGHVVDRFGLSTMKQKTDAIAALPFPKTLQELDYFLGLAGYYRFFVERFGYRANPLNRLKMELYREAPRKNPARDQYSRSKRIVNPSDEAVKAFEEIKNALCAPPTLVHADTELPLIYYCDASVERGFACAIHQVPRHVIEKHGLTEGDIINGNYDKKLEHPVMYLSQMLNRHEVNYWPTELEIAGIVWAIQKTRHLIKSSAIVKVFTDHSSVADVLSTRSLKTSSSVQQNLRHV